MEVDLIDSLDSIQSSLELSTLSNFARALVKKPQVILVVIFILNYLFLPLVLFLVEGYDSFYIGK